MLEGEKIYGFVCKRWYSLRKSLL